jgi:hypothetical protein
VYRKATTESDSKVAAAAGQAFPQAAVPARVQGTVNSAELQISNRAEEIILPKDQTDDGDPVNWQRDLLPNRNGHRNGNLPVNARTDNSSKPLASCANTGGNRQSSSSESHESGDDSDASGDVVYTKKTRTVTRLAPSGEQVTETETHIVKKRVRPSKRQGGSQRHLGGN